jgi:hypothetical protein
MEEPESRRDWMLEYFKSKGIAFEVNFLKSRNMSDKVKSPSVLDIK